MQWHSSTIHLTYNLDVAISLGDHQIMLAFDGQQTDFLKTHLWVVAVLMFTLGSGLG